MKPPEKKPVFDDPDAPPSADETALAESLRVALEAPTRPGAVDHEGAALLRAVALSHEPRAIDDAEHRAIVEQALAKRATPRVDATGRTRAGGGKVIRIVFGATGALAIAASVALFVANASRESAPSAAVAYAPSPPSAAVAKEPRARFAITRSTATLFEAPFAATARASARIDRIAAARGADLRENRFARWGVK